MEKERLRQVRDRWKKVDNSTVGHQRQPGTSSLSQCAKPEAALNHDNDMPQPLCAENEKLQQHLEQKQNGDNDDEVHEVLITEDNESVIVMMNGGKGSPGVIEEDKEQRYRFLELRRNTRTFSLADNTSEVEQEANDESSTHSREVSRERTESDYEERSFLRVSLEKPIVKGRSEQNSLSPRQNGYQEKRDEIERKKEKRKESQREERKYAKHSMESISKSSFQMYDGLSSSGMSPEVNVSPLRRSIQNAEVPSHNASRLRKSSVSNYEELRKKIRDKSVRRVPTLNITNNLNSNSAMMESQGVDEKKDRHDRTDDCMEIKTARTEVQEEKKPEGTKQGSQILTPREKKIAEAYLEAIAKQNELERKRIEDMRVQLRVPSFSSISGKRSLEVNNASVPIDGLPSLQDTKVQVETEEPTESTYESPTKRAKINETKEHQDNIWMGQGERTLRIKQREDKVSASQILYGLDAELARKNDNKLDIQTVTTVVNWVHIVVNGSSIIKQNETCASIFDVLKSGRLLCELVNKIRPGIVPKIHTRPIPLMEQENLKFYLVACERLGMRKSDLFVVSDLYEGKYLPAVLQNIIALSRIIASVPSFSGPQLQL